MCSLVALSSTPLAYVGLRHVWYPSHVMQMLREVIKLCIVGFQTIHKAVLNGYKYVNYVHAYMLNMNSHSNAYNILYTGRNWLG